MGKETLDKNVEGKLIRKNNRHHKKELMKVIDRVFDHGNATMINELTIDVIDYLDMQKHRRVVKRSLDEVLKQSNAVYVKGLTIKLCHHLGFIMQEEESREA